MTTLSSRVNSLSESQTIAMARKSREMKAKGIDIINLSLGEPDFCTPDVIKEFAKKAIDDNFSYYTHVSGYIELREAISKKFKRDNDLYYPADQIVVSTGAKQAIANAILSIINPGDEVIVPSPYWVSYLEIIKLAEGVPVVIPADIKSNFKVTADDVQKHITPKTKMFIFSSPCNPTGSVYSKNELEKLATLFEQYPDIYILSDEIYEHINFIGKHESIGQFKNIFERVITVNGVSKAFAMTGWRVGYMGASAAIAKACDKMQGQFTSGTCSIAQKAAHKAVELDPSATNQMKEVFKKRRDLVIKGLKEIPGLICNIPDGAFYVFPNVSSFFGKKSGNFNVKNATDLCLYLIEQAHVAIVPGEAFGNENYVRISYAASEEALAKAMERLKTALSQLK